MWYLKLIERELLPDAVLRRGIRHLLAGRLAQETAGGPEAMRQRLQDLVRELRQSPIALNTAEANQQHYEVPSDLYLRVLGPRLKYSCALYLKPDDTLARAEENMLDLVTRRAQLADGQDILDLGCGWGSFALYAAERFPASRVLGVSNSRTQRAFILERARARGLTNVDIVTADVNAFTTERRFDRVVSVEMFEHVRNYESLLGRVAGWMRPDARLFVHIFCHATVAYPFVTDGDNDWMARYFFTGGLMPSADLLAQFQRDVALVDQWAVDGRHYERTSNDWLANLDAHRAELWPVFEQAYGKDQARRWFAYWRIFFLSCAELFGYRGGKEWFVSHYLFARR
jgi:cyclopropane-fatty-acyl-phospholipid synthase